MGSISQSTEQAWKAGRKTFVSPKGWISGNAVCCQHNGESIDKRGRGAIKIEGDGISYHCFNCGFKTGYVAGAPLGYKFRKLLTWMGMDEMEIYRLSLEALRERQIQIDRGLISPDEPRKDLKVDFKKFPLPEGSQSLYAWVEFYELKGGPYPKQIIDAVEYVARRKIDFHKYELFLTEEPNGPRRMQQRVIVPFTWKNEIIGYVARSFVDDLKPKYYAQVDDGYVYNIDKQGRDWKFVIVCEGSFDAMSIDGVAVLKAEVTKQQVDIIESLDREIIVVPDWNKSGDKLIDVALANGWSVSFPVWAETCSDINQAVQKYGKLFVLKDILDHVERSKLKIRLRRKL